MSLVSYFHFVSLNKIMVVQTVNVSMTQIALQHVQSHGAENGLLAKGLGKY
jgi:hypothetical protein